MAAITNTCNAALANITAVAAVSGFTAEYAVQAPGGALSAYGTIAAANALLNNTPGCWTIKARYKLTAAWRIKRQLIPQVQTLLVRKVPQMGLFFHRPRSLQIQAVHVLPCLRYQLFRPIAGFNVEYSINGGGSFSASPSSTTPGCYTIQARYVTAAACGSTSAGTAGTGSCAASNSAHAVIFPTAPVISASANSCFPSFNLPTVASVSGFTAEYSIDGGSFSSSPTLPASPGCHTVKARYSLTSACGEYKCRCKQAVVSCGESNTVSLVQFSGSTCHHFSGECMRFCIFFTNRSQTKLQQDLQLSNSIDGGPYSASPVIPTASGCHTIQAQYVLTAACGGTPEEQPAQVLVVQAIL
jgi:hypothetical protein